MEASSTGGPVAVPAPAADELLACARWAYRTRTCRALDHRFSLRCTDPLLGSHLDELFSTFDDADDPEVTYAILGGDGDGAGGYYHLFADGTQLTTATTPAWIVSYLLWHLNRAAIDSSEGCTLVHAAGAAYGEAGIVLPAPMERGKTTLVAGLLKSGLRYLSDEAVAVDPASGLLLPFPKTLTLDPGSWRVHADLRPHVPPGLERVHDMHWHVPATAIRADVVAPPVPPAFVLAHRYEPDAATTLRSVPRAQALMTLMENRFDTGHGSRDLQVLADLVRRCDCYELVVGDLDEACTLILGVLEETTGRPATGLG